jgi:hypothetical protein
MPNVFNWRLPRWAEIQEAEAGRPQPITPNRLRAVHTLDQASKFQDMLRSFGIDTVLAGGACRDTIFGKVPKDFDLFILNMNDEQEIANRLYDAYIFNFRHLPKYGEARNPEYKGVFKICGTYDLVVWETPATCAREVVDRFDYNINQYWYEDGEVKFLDNPAHITGVLEEVNSHSCDSERGVRFMTEYGLNV